MLAPLVKSYLDKTFAGVIIAAKALVAGAYGRGTIFLNWATLIKAEPSESCGHVSE